ncbi:hypothetical protein M413DRAFT_28268 [Hebeloma cylindrosporum]|uniref:Uncharacterized protein n=1 Tax=Hebeloma cylindrosporum TaxID=76867 RepID=A0A0C3BUS8_HEBCY|nr:hypothetical protein M413DRAFT_28268 [Hebeloma cylindrosporum h7]
MYVFSFHPNSTSASDHHHHLLDPNYILLPPHHPSSTIPQSIENKIAIHFATHFSKNLNTVHRGDVMPASELFMRAEDCPDATYVLYDLLIDRNAHLHQVAPDWEEKPFYGQLKQILIVKLPPASELDPDDTLLHAETI